MFSRIGQAAYRNDLSNTITLCERLGDPHKKLRSVHIAGTNGKGSTSHMLAAIFQTAGYKTGLYTSPHLKDFRERIRINGEMITESFVTDFIQRISPVIDELKPSFFEITVAMAFYYFASSETEIAIIETGLGGRLDSTNIITPELSIITNISYDHMALLGDTLAEIASEKAGIIKPGIPVLIGESDPEIIPVIEKKAMMENAPIYYAQHNRYISSSKLEHQSLTAEVSLSHTDEKTLYTLDLPGVYQEKNLLTVLGAVDLLKKKGWKLEDTHVREALRNVKAITGLHGRWEMIHEHPAVILDVAHNEAGIKAIISQLGQNSYKNLHIVIGMVKDKEVEKVLKLLPSHATYYFTRSRIPRALPEIELADKAVTAGLKGLPYPDVNTALNAALASADREDVILVCGSVFVVGEVALR
jgi:dihydrofolate synthase/folylpolyglutamate synthase